MSETPIKKPASYESTHRLRKLLLVTTIVPAGQAQAIVELNNQNEAAMCMISIGKGTVPPELKAVIMATEKRDVIFSILREDCWAHYKERLEGRFKISKAYKGIAWAVPIDAVSTVSMYKMLSNTRLFEKPIKPVTPVKPAKPAKEKGKKKDE